MKWKETLIDDLVSLFNDRKEWYSLREGILKNDGIGVHVAIFNEPFLSAVLDGQKKVESRFSINRIDPFRKVYEKDIILIKESGGSIIGFFIAGSVEYRINNKRTILMEIKDRYNDRISAYLDEDFWQKKALSKYITLIEIKKVYSLKRFNIEKNDRTSWSVVKEGYKPTFYHQMRE